jgi:hypothetical protein
MKLEMEILAQAEKIEALYEQMAEIFPEYIDPLWKEAENHTDNILCGLQGKNWE